MKGTTKSSSPRSSLTCRTQSRQSSRLRSLVRNCTKAGRVIARLSRIVDHGAAAIDENLLRVRAVEIYLGHVQPPSNATVPHDAMRPLPPSRTPRTLAQNPRCAPSATPGLSTTTSSSGGLSTEPRNDDSACRTSWPAIVQQNADFGPYTRAGDDGSKIESNE